MASLKPENWSLELVGDGPELQENKKLAEQLNIQVFATTHSWDCIESFTKVAVDDQSSEGVLFRMGRSVRTSDNGKVIATVFDENQLQNITQADVEVR